MNTGAWAGVKNMAAVEQQMKNKAPLNVLSAIFAPIKEA